MHTNMTTKVLKVKLKKKQRSKQETKSFDGLSSINTKGSKAMNQIERSEDKDQIEDRAREK